MEDLTSLLRDAKYLPSTEITTISKLALTLKKPILVEGPPGVGKTALAKALATATNAQFFRIQCYEGITAEQVIGEFNYQRQLLAIELAQSGQISDVFTPEFFIARPLLQALQTETAVVLLIDEIDRADEEFEALLLEALAENQVTIPELGTIHGSGHPLVVLTSNATRQLSGALRRRSLYLALDYPTPSREQEIIKLHVPDLDEQLYQRIVLLLSRIRQADSIRQPPSISEGIELAQALAVLGAEYLEGDKLNQILGLLVKSKADTTALKKLLLDK